MNVNNFRNIEAEQDILGSILINNDTILQVVDILEPKDFYETKHMVIYDAMLKLYKDNKGIDITTVYSTLGAQIQDIGGITYLAKLGSSGIVTHISEHVQIIKEKSKLREINILLQKTLKEVQDGNTNSSKIISTLQNINIEDTKGKIITDSELMLMTCNIIEENAKNGIKILGIETGLKTLDKAINGLQKKKLYVIAGRPGMAKSAFALNITQKLSINHRIMYYSLEMGEEELGLRRLAMTSFIDSAKIERGNMTDEEWTNFSDTSNFISKGKCLTDCSTNISLLNIKAQCKKMQLQGGLDSLIIDYLGLISTKNMGDSLREQISNICIGLKGIAKDFNIPVIVLSQLSRACEARPNHRPLLSDLKETGGIEENADTVLLLYRDEYYNKETEDKNILEVNIAKQRGGRTGTIKLAWVPQYQLVGDLDYTKEGTFRKDLFKK